MKLTDYNPDDQIYFIKTFIEKSKDITNKFNKTETKPEIESLLLSQILSQK